MLVSAALFAGEIIEEMQKRFYTKDMFFASGGIWNWVPDIAECPTEDSFQYAIVDGDRLIGYLGYKVDWYCDAAYNFGLISFDKGNPLIGKDLFAKMEELVNRFHRVEWKMIGGNPVERSYDRFCKKHNGNKIRLRDT